MVGVKGDAGGLGKGEEMGAVLGQVGNGGVPICWGNSLVGGVGGGGGGERKGDGELATGETYRITETYPITPMHPAVFQ